MNSNVILHFTVNSKGWLRLHETSRDAVSVKEKDEVVVQISLTKAQMAVVLRAEGLAREKKQTTHA